MFLDYTVPGHKSVLTWRSRRHSTFSGMCIQSCIKSGKVYVPPPNFQYLIMKPFVLTTAFNIQGIESKSDFISTGLMASHIAFTIRMRSALFLMAPSIRSRWILTICHTFSMILVSGLWLGLVKVWMPCCSFHASVSDDRCTGQLSSWRIQGWFSKFSVLTGQIFTSSTFIYLFE